MHSISVLSGVLQKVDLMGSSLPLELFSAQPPRYYVSPNMSSSRRPRRQGRGGVEE